MIEITEDKAMDMKEHAKKILKHGKELFECIEELADGGSRMGERGYGRGGRMGYRHDDDGYDRMGERGYGRYGMRDEDMRPEDYERMGERYPRERWEEWPPYMGERRGRSASTGRYVRR